MYPPISILTLQFWTPHFLLLDSTLFRLDSTFWLDSTLKLNSALTMPMVTFHEICNGFFFRLMLYAYKIKFEVRSFTRS